MDIIIIVIHAWWISIKITAMSRKGDFGRRENALEWLRSKSPKAQ